MSVLAGMAAPASRRASTQRVVTLALEVLDDAAYRSRTHTVDTREVRLALTALWLVLRDRSPLLAYWERANHVTGCPWESCRQPYNAITKALRDEGWHAPVGSPPLSGRVEGPPSAAAHHDGSAFGGGRNDRFGAVNLGKRTFVGSLSRGSYASRSYISERMAPIPKAAVISSI